MEKKLTYIVIVVFLAVLIFGKYYQNIFPQIINGTTSDITISVPSGWILEKGTKEDSYNFQLILPSKTFGKPAGFISGKNLKISDFKLYVKENEENKSKTNKNFQKESGFSKLSGTKKNITLYMCKYTVDDKNASLETVEFIIFDKKNKSLWHLVSLVETSYFKEKKNVFGKFFENILKNNYELDFSQIFGDKKGLI